MAPERGRPDRPASPGGPGRGDDPTRTGRSDADPTRTGRGDDPTRTGRSDPDPTRTGRSDPDPTRTRRGDDPRWTQRGDRPWADDPVPTGEIRARARTGPAPGVSTRATPVFAPPTAPASPGLPADDDLYGAPDPYRHDTYGERDDAYGEPGDTYGEPDRPAERARRSRSAPGPRPELPYVAAFDGLRAVALLAILAFHQGFELARGGFLGISSFLTLSGFLVATFALAEWSSTGSLALSRFWQHRARRLVPAFAVTVAAVVALQVVLRVGSGPGYRGDVLAALGQVLNWRYAFGDSGFARALTDPSPVQHLWSISLLAQITVLLPLVFVGLMKLAGTHWRRAGAAFTLLAAGSFAAAWFTAGRSGNDGVAYFGTHTRVGELLVGVVLAYVVLSPRVRRAMASPTGVTAVRYGTPVALLALAWLWMSTGLYSTNLFGGITAVNAVLTAWVIFAVTTPGPATTVLGSRPLRLLGRISYAAYLLHWPLFLLLDEDRTGLDGVLLFGVRLAATVVAGAALTFAVERPMRSRMPAAPRALAAGSVAVLAAIAVAAVVLPEQPPPGVTLTIGSGDGPGRLDVVAPTGDEAASIALVGGSLADSMVPGLEAWNADRPNQQVRVATHVAADCPLAGSGEVRSAGRTVGDDTACLGFGPRLPHLLDAADPDVVVVVPGAADLGSRELDNEWVHLGDPVYDTWMRQHLDDVADTLADAGVPVIWATSPHVRLAPGGDLEGDWTDVPDNDPARVDRLNEIIREVVAGRDGMSVIDLGWWAQRLPRGEFGPDQRAEGRDLTEDGSARAAAWVVPRVFDVLGIEVEEPEAAPSG